MAWTATLQEVNANLDKRIDGLEFTVEFNSDDARSISKTYIIWSDELADTNLTTLKAKVDEDLARLVKLDDMITKLEAKIGQTI